MKTPGPDHPISVEPFKGTVRVVAGGKTLVDTSRALVLREASYKPVYFLPRDDADMAALTRTAHSTHCPYKGDASYFSINGGRENAIWSYETPFPAVATIREHLAFYPDRVDAIEVTEG